MLAQQEMGGVQKHESNDDFVDSFPFFLKRRREDSILIGYGFGRLKK